MRGTAAGVRRDRGGARTGGEEKPAGEPVVGGKKENRENRENQEVDEKPRKKQRSRLVPLFSFFFASQNSSRSLSLWPHLAHDDVKGLARRELLRGELARRSRGDCKRVRFERLRGGFREFREEEKGRKSFLLSREGEQAKIDRRFSNSPRASAPPFLRPRPNPPPKRHTTILVALERSSKLRDVIDGHHENLHLEFFFFVVGTRGSELE